MTIIGREKEIEEFRHLYDSGKAEFVAIYGRRRVGKTFLVDETLFLLFPSGIWAEEEKVPGIMDGGFLYVVAAFGK